MELMRGKGGTLEVFTPLWGGIGGVALRGVARRGVAWRGETTVWYSDSSPVSAAQPQP